MARRWEKGDGEGRGRRKGGGGKGLKAAADNPPRKVSYTPAPLTDVIGKNPYAARVSSPRLHLQENTVPESRFFVVVDGGNVLVL